MAFIIGTVYPSHRLAFRNKARISQYQFLAVVESDYDRNGLLIASISNEFFDMLSL